MSPNGSVRRPTIRDVAERAGVSIASVSMVLNGKAERIAAEMQRAVLSVAQQLGYYGHAAARSLSRRRRLSSFIETLDSRGLSVNPNYLAFADPVLDGAPRQPVDS